MRLLEYNTILGMPFKDKYDRYCGFLDIDEQDKRKKFQRRYFVVNKSKGLLEWYLDSPANLGYSAQPCGIINLDYITKVDEAKKMKMDNCFVINTPFRPYYVQGSNQVEVEQWVEILNDASKIIVPPEAINPQPDELELNEYVDLQDNSFDGSTESNDPGFTYRTEIVGNVVVKKKLSEVKKPSFEEAVSPPINSIGSDFKFPITPDNVSLHPGFFNANDEKEVIKKGWAVKQGHVVNSTKKLAQTFPPRWLRNRANVSKYEGIIVNAGFKLTLNNDQRKNWKRRFFILKSDGFAYYKSEQDKEPLRTVSMNDILIAKSEDGELSRLRDNLLLVATTDKIYYMQTDSPDEMYSWIEAFNNAIKAHKVTDKKHQATYREGYDLGGPPDAVDAVDSVQFHIQHLKNRAVSQSIPLGASQDSIGNSTCSCESLEKLHVSDSPTYSQIKTTKTHRRAESAVTALPKTSLESTPTSMTGLASSRVYTADDVQARPESVHFDSRADYTSGDIIQNEGSLNFSKPNGDDYVCSHLDPQIDFRSAVKPSSVKKKKNPGILFSLNTMLSRKQDKIQKEKARLKNNS